MTDGEKDKIIQLITGPPDSVMVAMFILAEEDDDTVFDVLIAGAKKLIELKCNNIGPKHLPKTKDYIPGHILFISPVNCSIIIATDSMSIPAYMDIFPMRYSPFNGEGMGKIEIYYPVLRAELYKHVDDRSYNSFVGNRKTDIAVTLKRVIYGDNG